MDSWAQVLSVTYQSIQMFRIEGNIGNFNHLSCFTTLYFKKECI